jgi:hypothetical protein
MTARFCCIAFAALLASACGSSSVSGTSAYLDPLENADDPRPGVPGERCNLATLGGESDIVLVAFQDAAIVRVDGEPVTLRFQGSSLRGGGTFGGEGLTVMIGGISGEMASLTGRVGIPVVVAARHGDSVETFEAVWTCGIMRPEPAGG